MMKERKNILLLEDEPGHAILVQKAFEFYKDEYKLQVVTSLKAAREFLNRHTPHLVIVDLVLPDGNGSELLPPGAYNLPYPIIIMTGYGDEQKAVEILKSGALDYVVKLESNLRDMPRIVDRALREWEHIVERRHAENALAESEEKFRALIEKSSDLVAVLSRDCRFQYVSPASLKITQFPPDFFINKKPMDLLHPDDDPAVYYILEQSLLHPGVTIPIPYFRFRHSTEGWVILEGVISNLLDIPGISGLVMNCRDVTRLKLMEEGLHRMQKLESIGILAGGIAHDYNNLLTIILGNLTMARMAESREKLLQNLDDAENGVFKARDLTQQLLTFAKGGAPIKETASVEDMIRDSASFTLRGSKVSIKFQFDVDIMPVDVDKGQFSQVIHNLVLNASQAMPDGGEIIVAARKVHVDDRNIYTLKAGEYVYIEIADKGVGIPESNRHRIFDPFFTTKVKGSGLGLSIVYSVIKRHNGVVDFKSVPGEGTTFFIFLPVSENEVVKSPKAGEPLLGHGNILVMDDEESIRDVASMLLEALGYTVSTVKDGEQAIELCKKQTFDVIVMDLTVPGGMGGCEAARRIREFDSHVKLMVSSGYSNDPVMSEFHHFGFDGVLMKPYRLEQLSHALADILKSE